MTYTPHADVNQDFFYRDGVNAPPELADGLFLRAVLERDAKEKPQKLLRRSSNVRETTQSFRVENHETTESCLDSGGADMKYNGEDGATCAPCPLQEDLASAPSGPSEADVEKAVNLAREKIRAKWLKNHAGDGVSPRTRLLHVAAASDLSDAAFRILFIQQSFGNGGGESVFPTNDAVAAVMGRSTRGIGRANRELERAGWVVVKRRRRESAVRSIAIPERLQSEIMEILAGPRMDGSVASRGQEATNSSSLGGQEATNLSVLGDQEATDSSLLEFKNGQIRPLLTEKVSITPGQEATDSSCLDVKNGQIRHFQSFRSDESVRLPFTKEKKTTSLYGESENKNRARGDDASQPPGDLDSGEDGREPPVPEREDAPSAPEGWADPKARMLAFSNHYEAAAQKDLRLLQDGRLEISQKFRAELTDSFPLVDVAAGLAAAAANVSPEGGALRGMQAVRRQFGYMQQDAASKAKNYQAAVAANANKKAGKQEAGRRKIPGMEGLYYAE